MGLDVNALKEYDRNKVFPADKYEAMIKKVTVKRDERGEWLSTLLYAEITNYAGTKKGGLDAIGSEYMVYMADEDSTDVPFVKAKYKALTSSLIKATDMSSDSDMSEDFLTGKIVHVALDQGKGKFKEPINVVAFFEHA